MRMPRPVGLIVAFVAVQVWANPYPDPLAVPRDTPSGAVHDTGTALDLSQWRARSHEVLRVEVEWDPASDTFRAGPAARESSGTEALLKRAPQPPELGSYHGILIDRLTGQRLAYDAVGTGASYRRLTRALTFRFPFPSREVEFLLVGEDPKTGEMREILRSYLHPEVIPRTPQQTVEARLLRKAGTLPDLQVVIYAEGYADARKARFWQDAARVVQKLEESRFPGQERMTFTAVFAPSRETLGSAKNLGLPVAERDSFLGLYFPYWNAFGRWYHVVYPTRERRYRDALAQVPYDYPIALVDSASYWGVGNFMELTAIPARSNQFTYLLLHEIGHFFGLNEEYESGGPTELAFAPGIEEPWSQNITFSPDAASLKWRQFVNPSTPVPTPKSHWSGNGPWGAYRGGYAETEPKGASHKPGFNCIMSSGSKFCPVCHHAIDERVKWDLGEAP